MKIEKLMTTDVESCRPEERVDAAAKIMWERDCGCVPVVDASPRVVGMITDRDICMAAYTQGKPLGEIPVSSVMTGEVWCSHPGESALEAEALMRDKRIRRLPVVDAQGRLRGILSLNDLARKAATGKGKAQARRDGVALEEVAETLRAVGEPRPQALVRRGV